uniref:Nuclease n=1 Tax=Myoviridae sp. ctMb725 TaxID=2825088 RepID=A0A8S5PVR5_9CAUD|nr:MAG TPA: Nuclease [Myoviridae sp. ctMb725]
MRESQIEARLSREVKHAGGLCLKWVSPGCTGVMDRIVLLPGGRVIFVELKQPGGRLSERQKWMADALARLGMAVRCLWNKEQVDKFLEEVTRGGIPSA